MNQVRLERLAEVLRVELFVAAGLLVSACEQESPPSECHELHGCIVDTTTWGPDLPSETGEGGTETGSDDGYDPLEPWQEPYTRIDCVPLPDDGTCPALDSTCLRELLDNRHGSPECSCGSQHVFSGEIEGLRPEIDDACCYAIEFVWLDCVAGRPFLVDGELRRAPGVTRADWACTLSGTGLELPAAERERQGRAWLEAARLEHASVAAFARMAAQLLGLGAPPSLLVEVLAAQADELEHARLCFAIASELLGRPLGPGPLDVSRAVGPVDLQTIVTALIVEGCLGETIAAAQAGLAAARAEVPVLAAAHERIRIDETRHAGLAVRTLAWLCAHPVHGRRTRAIVAGVRRELEASLVAGSDERRQVAAHVREAVVVPLLRALG